MKKKIFSILFALVLVLSFSLIPTMPVVAVTGATTTLTVPDNVYRPAEFVASSTTTNSGTAYTNVRFNITVSGPSAFTGSRADTFTITKVNGSTDTQGINDTFVLVDGDWVGYWGPVDGFPLTDPYGPITSTFTVQMCDVTTAPVGNYDVTVELVDLTPDPDVTLDTDTDSFTLSADTLHVGTGQQFTTIQAAIDVANTGDTINVAAGTYKEHITIDKSNLNLIGVDRETTIIDATQDSSWPVAKPGILIGEYPLVDGVHDVKVSGFTIRDAAMQEGGVAYTGDKYGVGPGGLAGIQIYNSSNNTIENNILINNYWQIWLVAEWPAAGYTECINNRIANNIIQNSENDGVYLYSDGGVFVQDTQIVNNEISNAYGEYASGIEFWGWPEGGPTPTIKGTVIKGNNITSCTYGVRIRSGVSDISETSVNFNNLIGNTNYGIYNGVTSTIDATHNWWGDISGPKHDAPFGIFPANPGGTGDRVSDNVNYVPWLTREFETVLEDNIAYFGIPMVYLNTGWNTFSTPIALDPACDTWGEYIGLGDGLAIYPGATTYYFDGEEQVYRQVLGSYRLKPCDAIYVRMLESDIAAILLSPEFSPVASKELYAGWNLVSLAWLPEGPDGEPCMALDRALATVDTVTGDLTGWSLVVNPPVNWWGPAWPSFLRAQWSGKFEDSPPMCITQGYWVFMINDGTLAGFTSTPIPLEMPH